MSQRHFVAAQEGELGCTQGQDWITLGQQSAMKGDEEALADRVVDVPETADDVGYARCKQRPSEAQRPFDLERGPLFRSSLLQLGEEEQVEALLNHAGRLTLRGPPNPRASRLDGPTVDAGPLEGSAVRHLPVHALADHHGVVRRHPVQLGSVGKQLAERPLTDDPGARATGRRLKAGPARHGCHLCGPTPSARTVDRSRQRRPCAVPARAAGSRVRPPSALLSQHC